MQKTTYKITIATEEYVEDAAVILIHMQMLLKLLVPGLNKGIM